ncbi:unnamed protein product [Chondrus crispus]|uniref:RING-type E3 ubiquitin transferase n=1 Tax=Chondrus crispus TaxID=2769 RepID=R7QCG2_CHOCR|nr:unnamed protein product [Chondrus crispus]CDF35458.1 unnamed protein product [Chondrus crispus]|eukprot:XP_005715277.1 unnamed protein product [Chondrus crispus]
MDLYYQEHDVRPNERDTASTQTSTSTVMLRLALLVARMSEATGPEHERLAAAVDHLLAQVSDTDPSMPGKPPASAESIRTLPVVNMRPGPSGPSSCPICTEEYEFNEPAKRLPCGHTFHADCVVPWLRSHCTCPLCRAELPTDDLAYMQRKRLEKRREAVSQLQHHMLN